MKLYLLTVEIRDGESEYQKHSMTRAEDIEGACEVLRNIYRGDDLKEIGEDTFEDAKGYPIYHIGDCREINSLKEVENILSI